MDAVEQAVPQQPRDLCSQHRLHPGRNELHRAVAAVARDDVAHVSRQQAIPVFLEVEQRDAGARQRLGAEGKSGGIERRRRHAERHEYAARGNIRIRRRQHVKMPDNDQDGGTRQRQCRCESDHAARCRKCRLKRNNDKPDCSKRFDAAGGYGHRHDEPCQRQRGQHVRALVAAGARQKPGQQNGRNKPREGRDLQRSGRAAHRKIDRKCRECREATQ